MIAPRSITEQIGLPKLPLELFEVIHNVSLYLLVDDKYDLGRGQYYNRSDHFYHGNFSPDHPSSLHHWILGYFGILTSQIGSAMVKAFEMFDDYNKLEKGDLSGIDKDIIDLVEEDTAIPLEDYKQELAHLPVVQETKRQIPRKDISLEIPRPLDLPNY